MARERKEVVVEGKQYSICQISPIKAGVIFMKLVKIFAPVFGKSFLSNGKKLTPEEAEKLKTTMKDTDILEMIETVSDKMNEEEIMDMAVSLLANTYPMGSKIAGPSKLFKDKNILEFYLAEETDGVLHLFKLVWEVLRIQYSDFLSELGTPASTLGVPEEKDTVSLMVP